MDERQQKTDEELYVHPSHNESKRVRFQTSSVKRHRTSAEAPEDSLTEEGNSDPYIQEERTDKSIRDLQNKPNHPNSENTRPMGIYQTKLMHESGNLLMDHENCDESCRLGSILLSIDQAVKIKPDCPVQNRVITETQEFVDLVIDTMRKANPSLSFSSELRGSMSNGLKVGQPNEVDYLLNIPELCIRESDGWKAIEDSNEYLREVERLDDPGIKNCFQVVRNTASTDAESQYQALTDMNLLKHDELLGSYLSAAGVKCMFVGAVHAAIEQVKATNPNTAGKPSSRGHFVACLECSSTDLVRFFLENVSFGVSIDMTPSIRFHKNDGCVFTLVPKSSQDTWQLGNEDPQALRNPVVCQAIRVIKCLCDVYAHTTDNKYSSHFYPSIFRVIQQDQDGSYECQRQLSSYLTNYFSKTAFCARSKVPSYATVGSVVQQTKHDSDIGQSLCFLVLSALKNFALTNPDGKLLLGSDMIEYECYQTLYAAVGTLRSFLVEKQEINRFPKLLPLSYREAATGLGDDLRERYPTFKQFSHTETKSPGVLKDNYETEIEGVWQVYQVKSSDLASLLEANYPLLDYHGIENYGLEDGVSLRNLLKGSRNYVHVAVLIPPPGTAIHAFSFEDCGCLSKFTRKQSSVQLAVEAEAYHISNLNFLVKKVQI